MTTVTNDGIIFPDQTVQTTASGGGGGSTLDSLGIPNHDKVAVDADGHVSIAFNRAIEEPTTYLRVGAGRAVDMGVTTDGTSSLLKCSYQNPNDANVADNGNNRKLTVECDEFIVKTGASAEKTTTERMRVTADGHLYHNTNVAFPGVSNTSTGLTFESAPYGTSLFLSRNDNAVMSANLNSDGPVVRFRRSGNQVGSISVTSTATAYNTSSDYRLKDNITAMTGGIEKLKQLKPSTWTWKEDGSHGQGFVAHEVQKVISQAVSGTKDAVDNDGSPIYQGIDQSKLVPLLTSALQEAIAKIEDLETRVQELEKVK